MLKLKIDRDKDISTISNSEYRELPVISQGILKKSEYDPSILIKNEPNKKSKFLEKGSVLDLIILTHDKFISHEDVMKSLSNELMLNDESLAIPEYGTKAYLLLDYMLKNNLSIENDTDIISSCIAVDYYGNYTDVKRIELVKKLDSVLLFMKEAKNKIITTVDDINKAIETKDEYFKFLKSKFPNYNELSHVFKLRLLEDVDNDIQCIHGKGELDHIMIDMTNHHIYLLDLKTGGQMNFMESFWSFQYYYQLPFYQILLQQYIMRNIDNWHEFTISCHYIYINTINYTPVKYNLSKNFIDKILYGGDLRFRKIKGLYPLIQDFIYYINEEKYDFPKYYYDNHFDFDIDE